MIRKNAILQSCTRQPLVERLEESPDTRDSVQTVVGNARLGNPRDANRNVKGEILRPLRGELCGNAWMQRQNSYLRARSYLCAEHKEFASTKDQFAKKFQISISKLAFGAYLSNCILQIFRAPREGEPLEVIGNGHPRYMAALDRIRLTVQIQREMGVLALPFPRKPIERTGLV